MTCLNSCPRVKRWRTKGSLPLMMICHRPSFQREAPANGMGDMRVTCKRGRLVMLVSGTGGFRIPCMASRRTACSSAMRAASDRVSGRSGHRARRSASTLATSRPFALGSLLFQQFIELSLKLSDIALSQFELGPQVGCEVRQSLGHHVIGESEKIFNRDAQSARQSPQHVGGGSLAAGFQVADETEADFELVGEIADRQPAGFALATDELAELIGC